MKRGATGELGAGEVEDAGGCCLQFRLAATLFEGKRQANRTPFNSAPLNEFRI
jgi:hypothetical protein